MGANPLFNVSDNNDDRRSLLPAFRVWLCGTFRIERYTEEGYQPIRTSEWGGSSYPRLLLKALLCCPGRQSRREALLELLWSESEFEQAVSYLNTATTKLRKVLQPAQGQESVLIAEDNKYSLRVQEILWVDTDAALALLRDTEYIGRKTFHAIAMLEEAITYLSRGTFLEDEEGLWIYGHRKDLKEALYNSRRWLAEAYVEQNMLGQAELQWRALLTDDPTDEDVLFQAMAQFRQHKLSHKASRLYAQIVEQLAEDGLEPSDELQEFNKSVRDEHVYSLQGTTVSGHILPHSSFLFLGKTENPDLFRLGEPDMLLPRENDVLRVENPAVWFGGRLAHLQTLIEGYCGQPLLCQELQEKLGKELNSMPLKADDEEYTLSRRQLLISLAMLPTALLLAMLQGRFSSGRIEQFVTRCATSLTACWHLMRGCEYTLVEEMLATSLPLLATLAQETSKYQRTAASLATQGYRLKGILALHRNDVLSRDSSFQRAVYYAELSGNPGLLVAALISLAYHKSSPVEAEQLYQKALIYERGISPLQRSRLYVELSIAYAQENRKEDAIRYFHLAQQEYPEYPENDPSFFYAEFSPSSMILEKGRVHLALSHHYPNGPYPQQAWDTFAYVNTDSSQLIISERIRYEIVNYQAETALALQERDLCCECVEQGARGALHLGSAKRRKEVLMIRNNALKQWPHDGRVKELKYLFA